MSSIPADFGGSWDNFRREWCLDAPPPFSEQEAAEGLQALIRHFPEYTRSLLQSNFRGLLSMSPAVDFGRIIADCEHLDGFGPVMERVKAHEQGASSELVVGAMLVRLGYHPLFGAPLEGKVLDLRVDLGPTAVYFEVAAPHRSDVTQEAQQLASDLTRRLQSQNPACRVEIALLTDLTEEASKQIGKAFGVRLKY